MINTWADFFKSIKNKPYAITLHNFLNNEYANHICYPPRSLIFNAFNLTPVNEVKVVIFGQDPYHEPNQAMGLCFSVNKGIKLPPSLINIYKEIEDEYNFTMDYSNGDLSYLAKQGVLLLNAILSVQKSMPLSHNIKEYTLFFQDVLTFLNQLEQPIVFLLWGGYAKALKKYLNNPNHLILECNHPSPLSANKGGWFKNNHFVLTNQFLKQHNLKEINWCNK